MNANFDLINSTRKLVLKRGGYTSDRYVESKTGESSKQIESPSNPLLYRPGIYSIVAGLFLQIGDIIATQHFNYLF